MLNPDLLQDLNFQRMDQGKFFNGVDWITVETKEKDPHVYVNGPLRIIVIYAELINCYDHKLHGYTIINGVFYSRKEFLQFVINRTLQEAKRKAVINW